MARVILPRHFEMEMLVREEFVTATAPSPVPPNSLPTVLRWRVTPFLGMPREPFQVFQRMRELPIAMRNLLPEPVNVAGRSVLEWGRIPLMELRIQAAPNAGSSLQLQALDDFSEPIPAEVVTVNAPALARLRTPNICALEVTGNGQVTALLGVSLSDLTNAPEWQLIETVGLPVLPDRVAGDVYDTRLQGAPGALKPGVDAARDRLTSGLVLFLLPPATGPGEVVAPSWPAPPPDQVIGEVRALPNGPLALVLEMLRAVDPDSADAPQERFERAVDVPGFHAPGGTAADTARANLRVAPLALLMAASEYWSALVWGFRTNVFPPRETAGTQFVEPNRPMLPIFDYMVTVNYRLLFGIKLELAAIAAPRFAIFTPSGFQAATARRNRPPTRDLPYSDDVELRWARLIRDIPPHTYAVAVLQGGGAAAVLNEKRSGIGFVPYLPAVPAQADLTEEARVLFVDNIQPAPLTGSRTDTYLCAALDVFGRWSPWVSANRTSVAGASGVPQLLSARFNLDTAGATGRQVPASLEIEWVWDWQDRSPQRVQFAGVFFDPAAAPPAGAPGGMQRQPGGLSAALANVDFAGDTPSIPPSVGTVVQLPAEPTDDEIRRYRLTLTGFTADFSAATRLAYAVYARARENVNPAFSAFTPPLVTRVNDPLPAAAPIVVPVINWTALPDATGVARRRLTFPAVPHAASYNIYEASEAAIRAAAGLAAPASLDLMARATDLLAAAASLAAADMFARVNSRPLTSPEVEVSLPGATDGLFAYTFTSVTAEQVESARSGLTLVAVPRRMTPGTPSLLARAEGESVRIRVVRGGARLPRPWPCTVRAPMPWWRTSI